MNFLLLIQSTCKTKLHMWKLTYAKFSSMKWNLRFSQLWRLMFSSELWCCVLMWQDTSTLEDGGSKVVSNVGILPHHYIVSQPRRPWLLHWKTNSHGINKAFIRFSWNFQNVRPFVLNFAMFIIYYAVFFNWKTFFRTWYFVPIPHS